MLKLDYRKYTPLTIKIIDGLSEEVLDVIDKVYEVHGESNFAIYTGKYFHRGIKVLEVQVVNNDNGRREISYHRLDPDFSIERK